MDAWQDIITDLGVALALIAAVAVALGVHALVYALAGRLARRTRHDLDGSLLEHTRNPARVIFSVAAIFVVTAFLVISDGTRDLIHGAAIIVGILGVGWLVVGLTLVGYDAVMQRHPQDVEDNLQARAIGTQLSVLQRMGAVAIWLLAAGIALLTVPGVQPLAASMLASAGIAGIVLGVAAGPIISNLIAGIQIAFAQPIRLDDVVVIDGEWGRVEEITATYVVVNIWDRRRLIVPLSRIVNSSVENWTRQSADLLGTVSIYADYRTPVDEIRAELKRILDESGMWDGEAWGVQVTDATESTMKVRALMSAPDSGTAWDLRCLVREKLIAFLQEQHPESLPTMREIEYRVGAPGSAG